VYQGYLVDVPRGPGGAVVVPPDVAVPVYPPSPRRGFGGYDELDPWLGSGDRR
jgi:hypothetical protein